MRNLDAIPTWKLKEPAFHNADYWQDQNTEQTYTDIDDLFADQRSELIAVHSKLLVGDQFGIYIPQCFIENFDLTKWHEILAEDIEVIAEGPEHEWYWEAWASICANAYHIDEHGNKWHLEQEGDLFAKLYIEKELK